MILDELIIIKPFKLKKYYISKGYEIDNASSPIEVKVLDLPKKSHEKIKVCCDICGEIVIRKYFQYLKNYNNCNIYTCSIKCSQIKVKKTSKDKFGYDNAAKSPEIKEKTKRTNLERYESEYSITSKIIRDNFKEKHNVEYPSQLNSVKDKIKNKNKNTFFKKIEKIYKNNNEYIFTNYDINILSFVHKKCDNLFNITINNYHNREYSNICLCTHCFPISENNSIKEKEIVNWLKELNISFIESDRKILEGKELDIYIPSHNLAIEFNGLYYHSELYKNKKYHLEKSLKCQEKGIHLIHIWEDEWLSKQDIMKSIISNRLGLISNKIYARQCEIKVIDDSKLIRNFLDSNHIQGYSQSSIKLGLYFKDELVSLMTFVYKAKGVFELNRFCNKKNMNVIGAPSKLFKHFIKNYEYKELISYSDFRLFEGIMYETLGFNKKCLTLLDYFWCKNLERRDGFIISR